MAKYYCYALTHPFTYQYSLSTRVRAFLQIALAQLGEELVVGWCRAEE